MEDAQVSLLEKRRDEYRTAAVAAKRKGDRNLALGYAKIVKVTTNIEIVEIR